MAPGMGLTIHLGSVGTVRPASRTLAFMGRTLHCAQPGKVNGTFGLGDAALNPRLIPCP